MRPDPSDPRFELDDYEEVNSAYFDAILRERSWSALPAGWHNPRSAGAERFLPTALAADATQRYALDEARSLGGEKTALLGLISRWEARTVQWDEITLCPSVSAANLVALLALRRRGFDRIVFETPGYYATLEQAKFLGFAVERVASYVGDGFDIPTDRFLDAAGGAERTAVWLTQPRFGIGSNQDLDRLRSLAHGLGPGRALVLDEAAEQMFPSLSSALETGPCVLIRTRGLLKGVGLNGLRISMIAHPADWRGDFERVLESAGCSLDRFSLGSAASLAREPDLFVGMLASANAQVRRLCKSLSSATAGSWARPTDVENGYIGTLLLSLDALPGNYQQKRTAVLEYFREVRLPVVLRASIGFAHDPDWEGVRVNYFTPDANVETVGDHVGRGFESVRRLIRCA